MLPHEADAIADINATFAEMVIYTGAGLDHAGVPAVRVDVPAAVPFEGRGDAERTVSYEIQQADLPGEPAIDNLISDSTGDWIVISEPIQRDDVAAWVLIVGEA